MSSRLLFVCLFALLFYCDIYFITIFFGDVFCSLENFNLEKVEMKRFRGSSQWALTMILCACCETSGPISSRVIVTQRRLSGFVWVLESVQRTVRILSDFVQKHSAVRCISEYFYFIFCCACMKLSVDKDSCVVIAMAFENYQRQYRDLSQVSDIYYYLFSYFCIIVRLNQLCD